METLPLSLIATLGGFALTAGMGVKALREMGWHVFGSSRSNGDFLELYVNGKDFSVDLKTISNGGSEKIKAALEEFERCD